ncbi:hypothetical protein BJX64DRAFT_265934 [Aspergillus heterothallicus]
MQPIGIITDYLEEKPPNASRHRPRSVSPSTAARPYLVPLPAATSEGLHHFNIMTSKATPAWRGFTPVSSTMSTDTGRVNTTLGFQEPFVPYGHQPSQTEGFPGWPIQCTPDYSCGVPTDRPQTFATTSAPISNDKADCSSSISNLTIHYRPEYEPHIHSQHQHFQCKWEGCKSNATYKRDAELWRHIRTKHLAPDAYRCPVAGCGRTFGRSDHLKIHERVHQRQDQFVVG